MEGNILNENIYVKNEMQRDAVLKRLRESGFRVTKQRQLLLDIILEQDCASCKEMYYKAVSVDPSIGAATVYRMVNALEDVGVFSRKNLYKISCEVEKGKACRIEFDDNTFCELSANDWHKAVAEGLRACGYGRGKKVTGVAIRSQKQS